MLPTETWQAYNFRDDDGDGKADTWYADPEHNYEARLIRPFENRGVPPHYREYDEPFLRWLDHWNYAVDYLSDAELRRAQGSTLARAYDLIIFQGHHEYVTSREFDAVEGFREPRRQPDVPLRQQLLPQDHDRRQRDDARRPVPQARPARGDAHRRAVLRLALERAQRLAVGRARERGGHVDLRPHRARAGRRRSGAAGSRRTTSPPLRRPGPRSWRRSRTCSATGAARR